MWWLLSSERSRRALLSSMQLWRAVSFAILLFAVGVVDSDTQKTLRECQTKVFEDSTFKKYYCYANEYVTPTILESINDERKIAIQKCTYNVWLKDQAVKVGPLSINTKEEEDFVIAQFSSAHSAKNAAIRPQDDVLLIFRPNTMDFYDGSSNDYVRKKHSDQEERVKRDEVQITIDLGAKKLAWKPPRDLLKVETSIIVMCKASIDMNSMTATTRATVPSAKTPATVRTTIAGTTRTTQQTTRATQKTTQRTTQKTIGTKDMKQTSAGPKDSHVRINEKAGAANGIQKADVVNSNEEKRNGKNPRVTDVVNSSNNSNEKTRNGKKPRMLSAGGEMEVSGNGTTTKAPDRAFQQSSPSVQLLAFTCGLAAFLLRSLCIHWT